MSGCGTRHGLPGRLGRAYRVRVQENPLEDDEDFDPTYNPETSDQPDNDEEVDVNEEEEEEDLGGDAGYESLHEYIARRGYEIPPYLHYDVGGEGEEWENDWDSDNSLPSFSISTVSAASRRSDSLSSFSIATVARSRSGSRSSLSSVSVSDGEGEEMPEATENTEHPHRRVIVLGSDSEDDAPPTRPLRNPPVADAPAAAPGEVDPVETVENQPTSSGTRRHRPHPTDDSSDSDVGLNVRRRKRSRIMDSQDEEGQEAQPPAAAAAVREEEDDDDNGCTICYEEYTTVGDHRLVSLKCGHFFGKNCIERWIRAEGRSAGCPTCKQRAAMKDVRVHFMKSFKVVDNSEIVELRTRCHGYKTQAEGLEMDKARLIRELKVLQEQSKNARHAHVPLPVVIRSGHMKLTPGLKGEMCARGSTTASRAFDHNGEYFAVGVHCPGNAALFRPYGIRKVTFDNANQFKTMSSLPLHANRSRVVVFSPFETSILLSAGEDKKAVVHNMQGNAGQKEWKMPGDRQVWSACWISQSRFAVGLQDGRVYEYEKDGESSEPVRDITQGFGHFPIIFLAYDVESGVLVVASFKKVIAYCRDRVFPLISNDKDGFDSIRSVAWDARALSFAVTFSAGGGKTIAHSLYRLDIDNSEVSCIEVDTWTTPYVKCSTMWNNCLFSLEQHGIFSLIFCEDNRTLEAHDWSKKRQDVVLKFSTSENVCAMKALSGGPPNGKTIAVLTERSIYLVTFRLTEE